MTWNHQQPLPYNIWNNNTMNDYSCQLEQLANFLPEVLSMILLAAFLLHTGEVYEFFAQYLLPSSTSGNSRKSHLCYKASKRDEGRDDLYLQPTLDFTEASSEDDDEDYLHIIAAAELLRSPRSSGNKKTVSIQRNPPVKSSKHTDSSIRRNSSKKQKARRFASFEMIPEETGSFDDTSPIHASDSDELTNPSSKEDTTTDDTATEESEMATVKGNNASEEGAFSFSESQLCGRRRAVPMAALKSHLARARPPAHLSRSYAVCTSSLLVSSQQVLGGSSRSLRSSGGGAHHHHNRTASQPEFSLPAKHSPIRRASSLSEVQEDTREVLQKRMDANRRSSGSKHKDAMLLNRIVRSIHTDQPSRTTIQVPHSPSSSIQSGPSW